MLTRIVLVAALFLGGCAHVDRNLVLSKSLQRYASLWEREARTRFADPVLILGHGGKAFGVWTVLLDDEQGNSLCSIPLEAAIWIERRRCPGRPIVLIVCNPGKMQLKGFPGVWYAKDLVWTVPDRFFHGPVNGRGADPADPEVGSIGEFIEAR